MARKKTLGVGAKFSVLKQYLHLSSNIAGKYSNMLHQDRLDGLLVTGSGEKVINRNKKLVILFCHNDFENKVLYFCPKFAKVVVEGPLHQFFNFSPRRTADKPSPPPEQGTTPSTTDTDNVEIPDSVFHLNADKEDISLMRIWGFAVDDDNKPAP